MTVHENISVKQWFLYLLVTSVSVSALIGIAVILIGDFSDLETRILLTSLTISVASLCGVCCGASLDSNRARFLPLLGIGLAILASVMIIADVWIDIDSDAYRKTSATFSLFAIACGQMSLLLLANLAPRFRWSIWVAYVAVFGVATIICSMIWAETEAEWIMRLLGVTAILNGSVSILIPVFHRLSYGEYLPSVTSGEISLEEVEQQIAALKSQLGDLEQIHARLLVRVQDRSDRQNWTVLRSIFC